MTAGANPCHLVIDEGSDLEPAPGGRYSGRHDAGWSSSVARWAHNPEVGGSNPPPATTQSSRAEGFGGPPPEPLIVPCLRPQRDSGSVLGRRAAVIFDVPEQVAQRDAFAFFHVLRGGLLGEVRHSGAEFGCGPRTAVPSPLLRDPGSQPLEPCRDRGGQVSTARRDGRDHPRPSRPGHRHDPPSVRRYACENPHPARLDGPKDPLNPDIPYISHTPEANADGLSRAAAGVGLPTMTRAQAEETTCC